MREQKNPPWRRKLGRLQTSANKTLSDIQDIFITAMSDESISYNPALIETTLQLWLNQWTDRIEDIRFERTYVYAGKDAESDEREIDQVRNQIRTRTNKLRVYLRQAAELWRQEFSDKRKPSTTYSKASEPQPSYTVNDFMCPDQHKEWLELFNLSRELEEELELERKKSLDLDDEHEFETEDR